MAMMPRELADAPDIDNVPVADSVHTLMGAVADLHYAVRKISDHLGISPDAERTDTTELGDRVRELSHVVRTEESIEALALEVDGTVRYALHVSETAQNTQIEVYPVGALHDLRGLWARARAGRPLFLRQNLRGLRRHWRNRNYWNGYLAEVHYPPEGLLHRRCGHGWTRRRAARDLGLQLWKDNRR